VEPAQLQGARQSTRDVAGGRKVQQEEVPDYRTRCKLASV